MRYRIHILILLLLVSSSTALASVGRFDDDTEQQVERTVAAAPNVVVSVCVNSGSITVRGWDRPQVHARVSDGVPIELKRLDEGKTEEATAVRLVAKGSRFLTAASCLALGDVALDVPRGASLSLETNDGDVVADGVARIIVRAQSGTNRIARVTNEVDVTTIGGDISVSESGGAISLHTIGGSIEVRNGAPVGAEDLCDVGTIGGDIALDRVSHRRVKVNTIGGSVSYAGALARGGRYNFQSISGEFSLSLPADSSFRFSGMVGHDGEIQSDFSLKNTPMNDPPGSGKHTIRIRRVEAIIGGGDASVTISTFNGSISIRKK